MVLRDSIAEYKTEEIPDGQGGFISKDHFTRDIKCKASLNSRPEVMNAYGQNGEQVLYVVTRESLLREALYFFHHKKYNVRFETQNNRLFFSTLVEIK